mgnify:CR=1 FL=1
MNRDVGELEEQMSDINLDSRGHPWAERCMQDAVEQGASFDLDGLKDLLRRHLDIPASHRIILTTSHEEALSTAISGVATNCSSALWDVGAPAAMRAAVKALQRREVSCSGFSRTEKSTADLVALQWWNEETLHEHLELTDAAKTMVIDTGAALALGHRPDWSRPNIIWTFPGWSLCGPVASGWIILPSELGFTPSIHGTGQNPVRGGPVDPLLVWRVAGGLLHWIQSTETLDRRTNTVQELAERLETIGAERLSEDRGPGAVLHWPGIAAIGIARTCEARGLHIAAADACLDTKAEGSVGWTDLGRAEAAHEAVLITLDTDLTPEMSDQATATLETAVNKLRQLKS